MSVCAGPLGPRIPGLPERSADGPIPAIFVSKGCAVCQLSPVRAAGCASRDDFEVCGFIVAFYVTPVYTIIVPRGGQFGAVVR